MHSAVAIRQSEPDWLDILRAEVAKPGKTITSVGREIGYSRVAVSLALSGNYRGRTDRLAASVLATFCDVLFCPFLETGIPVETCISHATRLQPMTGNPDDLDHWLTCKTCPHRAGKDAS